MEAVIYAMRLARIAMLTRLAENILPDSTAAPGLLASQKEVSSVE